LTFDLKALAVAGQSGLIRKVGGVSVDGTKIKANASKHSAVSYQRAGKLIEELQPTKAPLPMLPRKRAGMAGP